MFFGIKSAVVEKEFDREPTYNENFLKTTIKSDSDEAADFHNKKMLKAGPNHTSLAVIIGSVCKNDKNWYLQVFSKECRYIEKKVIRYITDNLEISSDSDKKQFSVNKCLKDVSQAWKICTL